MYHVGNHAFFKALLFLGAGAVIYAMAHEQDMRRYGRLYKYLPVTFATVAVGWLAISGIPGLSGFYSKEAVIGAAMAGKTAVYGGVNYGNLAGWICLATALLTAMYMTRLMCLTFFGAKEHWREMGGHPHSHAHDDHHGLTSDHTPKEVPVAMWITLVVLAGLSVVGLSGNWLEVSLKATGYAQMAPTNLHPHGVNLMALSLAAAAMGLFAGLVTYFRGLPKSEGFDDAKWSKLRRGMANQFGVDRFLDGTSSEGGLALAASLNANIEKGLFGGTGKFFGALTSALGDLGRQLQNGYARMYALVMLCGVLGLLVYMFRLFGGVK
jgi:NADH-quinone oxidoreductase subunit L